MSHDASPKHRDIFYFFQLHKNLPSKSNADYKLLPPQIIKYCAADPNQEDVVDISIDSLRKLYLIFIF